MNGRRWYHTSSAVLMQMTTRGSRQEFQEEPILWALIRDLLARSEKSISNLILLCSHPVEDSLELSMLLHSLGETSRTRHHMHPWELLKSGNKEQRESLKWKALLWGGKRLTDNWAQERFLLPAGLDWGGDWVARNGPVLIYSRDEWMPNLGEVECGILGLRWGDYVWFRIYSQIDWTASPVSSPLQAFFFLLR